MFFEAMIPIDYEVLTNKHYVQRIEKEYTRLNFIEISNNNYVIKNTSNVEKDKKFSLNQFIFKYPNPFFTSLNVEQKAKLEQITNYKGLKHLILSTYSNDNDIAIKRLENIYNFLPPQLRVNTIYKQEFCYENSPCDLTNIKLIY